MQDEHEVLPLRLTAAAAFAGVSKATLHHAADKGELDFDMLHGRRLFYTDEISRWAESRRKAKAAA